MTSLTAPRKATRVTARASTSRFLLKASHRRVTLKTSHRVSDEERNAFRAKLANRVKAGERERYIAPPKPRR